MLKRMQKQQGDKDIAEQVITPSGEILIKDKKQITKDKIRKFLLGSKEKEGFLKVFVIYALLICIGFIYIYPILHMLSSSFMTLDDLLDSSINWIPSSFNLDNYKQAAKSMDFWKSFGQSVLIAGLPTKCNIILFTLILPSQVTMIPTYVLYSNMGILGTIWSFVLPSILGMGINAPIFILIFWQFFRQVPKVLIEAAQIDGAGYWKSFYRISLPSAAPAIITVSLFSFVWYWNESYLTSMYVSGITTKSGWTSLIIQLKNFATNYDKYSQTATNAVTSINESINMSGTMLSILPLLIMYFVLQRYFVESIDRTGITGEKKK